MIWLLFALLFGLAVVGFLLAVGLIALVLFIALLLVWGAVEVVAATRDFLRERRARDESDDTSLGHRLRALQARLEAEEERAERAAG